jgi:hypothetical protein
MEIEAVFENENGIARPTVNVATLIGYLRFACLIAGVLIAIVKIGVFS